MSEFIWRKHQWSGILMSVWIICHENCPSSTTHRNISPTLCDDQRVQKNQPKERSWANVMWKVMVSARFPYKGELSLAFRETQKVWPGVLQVVFHFCVIWRRLCKEDFFLCILTTLGLGLFLPLSAAVFFSCEDLPAARDQAAQSLRNQDDEHLRL